jgi:hypothetical protein
MRRTTLAIALATGALAIPAYALASGDTASPTQQEPSTAPVQQQRDHDCPEHDGSGGGSTGSESTQL